MCNASNSANIDTTAPLFHNLVTCVFPAGNGDKTYGHVNDVYLKTAASTGVRDSISDVISDQPAFSCGIRDVKSCQIRHPEVRIRYPDTSGGSHRIASYNIS